jgi:hypothetical protein
MSSDVLITARRQRYYSWLVQMLMQTRHWRWIFSLSTSLAQTRAAHLVTMLRRTTKFSTPYFVLYAILAIHFQKMMKTLGSIADMNRVPAAVFVVDIMKEHIAVAEAKRLGIPVFAMVDTNSDPRKVDFAIPSNDDATKSIAKILDVVIEGIAEGLSERKTDKDKEGADEAKGKKAKTEA